MSPSQSAFERYKILMGGEEHLPQQREPEYTAEEVAVEIPVAGDINDPELPDKHQKAAEDQPTSAWSAQPLSFVETSETPAINSEIDPSPNSPGATTQSPNLVASSDPYETDEKFGQVAPPGLRFCPLLAVSKFPYKFVPKSASETVADKFFNGGKFWENNWNLYYVWSSHANAGKPVIFITEAQLLSLVARIKVAFPRFHIAVPQDSTDIGLIIDFGEHPALRPHWLGKSHSRDEHDLLEAHAPFFNMSVPTGRSLEAFKAKMELAMDVAKNKSKAMKNRKKEERVVKQQDWTRQLLRAQRYLGLRPQRQSDDESFPPSLIDAPIAPSLLPATADAIAPYAFDNDVIFVAVDIEAYEHQHSIITEIGIATLDTRDLSKTTPGANAADWISQIRARHFRISEYQHLHNTEFVQGCADKFEFGKSEFISIENAPKAVADCFKEPFSKRSPTNSTIDTSAPKRNIVFLGHDSMQDITYLRQLGYDPSNLSNLIEVMDTASMYRALSREPQPRSLAHILYECDLMGWNLHNAGNDAVYTVQAMLAMCFRDTEARGKEDANEAAKKRQAVTESRVQAAKDNAEEKARDEAEGWSAEEGEDGGVPLKQTTLLVGGQGKPGFLKQNKDGFYGGGKGKGKENGSTGWR